MTNSTRNFNFASLCTSDYVDDSRQQYQNIFLIMLLNANDDEYVTLAYNSHPLFKVSSENNNLKNILSFNKVKRLETFYIFHKNKDDVLLKFKSNNKKPYRVSNAPLFVQVTEKNLLQIEHNISYRLNTTNHSFFCFSVKDLKAIFSYADKDISEFLMIYLEKMKIEPLFTLDNQPINFPKNLWQNVELNRNNPKEVSNLLFPTDSSHTNKDLEINLFFNRWHNPVNFGQFIPLSSWSNLINQDRVNTEGAIHSNLDFIYQEEDILDYQNQTYLKALESSPVDLYLLLKTNSPINQNSDIKHFEHLTYFEVNFMDYLPYLSHDDQKDIKIFMEINNIFDKLFNVKDAVVNSIGLRISHIQNLNGQGTQCVHSAFKTIYQENPEQVIPLLKTMSYVHDAYFTKPIMIDLFNYLMELGKNNSHFIDELARIKIKYYPFSYEIFHQYPAIISPDSRTLEINIRSLLSHIEDNRYEHIVNYTKLYFKYVLSALGVNDEHLIKEHNIDKFIFHSSISDIDKLSVDFSSVELLNNFSEEKTHDIINHLSLEFLNFIQEQQNISSHEPQMISIELREKILNFILDLHKTDISTHKKKKI